MSSRRQIIATASALAALASTAQPGTALAQTAADSGMADFLFVQTARRMSFDAATSKLSLHEVSPVTLFFADRPDRIAGNMSTAAFVPFWSTGRDSFLSDPPNADLSILEGQSLRQVVVVLRDPVLAGDTLSYTVRVLEGQMPATGADVSVFIDIIGMPRTPVSFAGAARRGYRRAWMR
ncbi:MAG: hypothetical protein WCP77_01755 [Roseococcus sp.]